MAVPVSLIVSSGLLVVTAAAFGSTRLAFHVTFILSYVFLERVMSPERVDRFFREVDAVVLGDLLNLRDIIRTKPLTAPIYAAAVERVRRVGVRFANLNDYLETETDVTLSGVKDVAAAAFLWIRLAVGVANLAATVLMNAALVEARSRAPQALRWRGVKGLRASPPNEEGSAPEPKKSTTFLVLWIAAIVAYCAQVATVGAVCSSIATFRMCFPCFAALCGFALMEAERVYLWDSYDIDTTGSSSCAADPGRDASGGGVVKEKELKDAWVYIWTRTMATHVGDAVLVAVYLGWRPFVFASLAIYNVAGLNQARQVYLTADDTDRNMNRWRRAVLKVLTIDIAKVVATYLAIDFNLGAALFVNLCWKAALFVNWAIYLSRDRASGDDDCNQEGAAISQNVAGDAEGSDSNKQEGAGLAEDVAGDAQGSEDDKDVTGDAQGSEDDDQEGAAVAGDVVVACDHEEKSSDDHEDNSSGDHDDEEGSTTEEHSDVSDSEEQRREESDSSSSSMDGWSFVGDDSLMPTFVNGSGADRKYRFFM